MPDSRTLIQVASRHCRRARAGGAITRGPSMPGALLLAALHLLAASLLLAGCGRNGPAGSGHLVALIIVDTLRADRLSCYGYDAIDTAHIDELAAGGILFEQATTAVPVTLPSISTILTGAYPHQHGIRDNGPFRLASSWHTLGERFSAAGFRTAAFVSAAVVAREHGLDQGFAVYDDDMSGPYTVYDPQLKPFTDSVVGVERRADVTVDRALDWARAQAGHDVFLLVHLFDPHIPRDPPPPYDAEYDHPYDGEIAFADDQIGRLLEGLGAGWGADRRLVALLSDHGEGLGDHGEELHGFLLFEETMRVPLILAGSARPDPANPDRRVRLPAGQRRADPARTIDVAPTLCHLMGLDGVTQSPGAPLVMEEASPPMHACAYLETFRPRLSYNWSELRGVRTQAWKYVHGPWDALYDLSTDPAEQHNLAERFPAVRDSLHELMNSVAFDALARGATRAETMALSPEQHERLQSLGYLTAAPSALPEAATDARADSQAVWFFPRDERGVALDLPHPADEVERYNRDLKVRSRYRQGRLALEAGDLRQAEVAFKRALEEDWGHADSWLGLAEAYERAGDWTRYRNILREARRSCPEDERIARRLDEVLGRVRPSGTPSR